MTTVVVIVVVVVILGVIALCVSDNVSRMYAHRVVDATWLERGIPGGVEMRAKGDGGGRGRGGRGTISSVLGGVLSSLVEL